MRTILGLLIIACWGLVFSSSAFIIEPIQQRVSPGDEVFLGTVAPGQTLDLLVQSKVTEGGKFGIGGYYDQVLVEAVPPGWAYEHSGVYERPMKAKIKVSPSAPDGEYRAIVRVVDERNLDELGDVLFTVRINVSKTVLSCYITPPTLTTHVSEPARFRVHIFNRGSASEVFEISSNGFPVWKQKAYRYIPYGTIRTDYYDVILKEEGTRKGTITVRATSNNMTVCEETVHINTRSNLIEDYRATGRGVLIFPIGVQIFYSLTAILGQLIPLP